MEENLEWRRKLDSFAFLLVFDHCICIRGPAGTSKKTSTESHAAHIVFILLANYSETIRWELHVSYCSMLLSLRLGVGRLVIHGHLEQPRG